MTRGGGTNGERAPSALLELRLLEAGMRLGLREAGLRSLGLLALGSRSTGLRETEAQ